MGNLVKSPQDILLNKISAKELGVYAASSGPTNKVFTFRGTTHHAPVRIKDNEVKRAWFALHTPAVKSSYILDFIAPAPCEECDYETGIVISHDHPYDGRFRKRDYRMYPKNRYYNAVLPAIETPTSNTLTDADRLEVMKQIIENINGDQPLNAGTVGSLATATMLYKVTDGNIGTVSTLDITVDGVTYPISATDDLQAAINGTATLQDKVVAYKANDEGTSTHDIFIMGKEGTGYFLVEEGTDTTLQNFYLKVNQKYSDIPIKFEWDSKEDAWDTVSKSFEWEVGFDAGNMLLRMSAVNSSGAITNNAIFDHASFATIDAAVDLITADSVADFAGYLGASNKENSGNTLSLFLYGFNDAVLHHMDSGSATNCPITVLYGAQQFSINDGETMYRHFPNTAGNKGTYPHIADPAKNYCQLHFEVNAPSAGGENVPDQQGTELVIYNFFFPEEELESNYWTTDLGSETAGTDRCFFALLHELSTDFVDNGVENFDTVPIRPDGEAIDSNAVLELLKREAYNNDNGWVTNLLSDWAKS